MAGIKRFNYSVSDLMKLPFVEIESYVNYLEPVIVKRAERTARKYPTHSKPKQRLAQIRSELKTADIRAKALSLRYWSTQANLSERGYAKSLRSSWEWVQRSGFDYYNITRRNVFIFMEFMEWARSVLDSSDFDSEWIYKFFKATGTQEIKKMLDSDRNALLKAYERFCEMNG